MSLTNLQAKEMHFKNNFTLDLNYNILIRIAYAFELFGHRIRSSTHEWEQDGGGGTPR